LTPVLLRKAINRTRRTPGDVRRWLLPYGYPGVRLTPRRVLNFWRVRRERRLGRERVSAYPLTLTIEATNVCNLRCPACFTGAGQEGRERSMLQMPLFEKVLDELGDRLLQVEFYNWGEPLLNKNIAPMIRKAVDKGVSTIISSNLSFPFSDERAEEIVASGLHILGVSVDGARQETYEQYRVRGDLSLVFENVRKINAAKRKLGSSTPDVAYEYHLFSHNLQEVEEARAIARELDMRLWVSKGWVAGPDWDREGTYDANFSPKPGRCGFLWDHAVVHNDGAVAPCCAVFYREDDYGQLTPERAAGSNGREPSIALSELAGSTFREVWNNERFRDSRRMFADAPADTPRKDLVCYDCPVTGMWRRYRKHLDQGLPKSAFEPRMAFNDGFNYFFSRRPPRATTEGLISLTPVDASQTETAPVTSTR
jgi:MoaA/NifB/PqqE/SkfB family radical SAM enzyme